MSDFRLPLYEKWLAFLGSIDAPWCVIVAEPGKEMAVQAALAELGWETYLPMQTSWGGPAKARHKANKPLFARYFLAACAANANCHVQIDGLVKVMRPPDVPAREPSRFRSSVSLDQVARLMLTEARHGFDFTRRQSGKPRRTGLV